MNEHFKIVEEVEYHIESIIDGEDGLFITGDYYDAEQSFRDGRLVSEHRISRHRSEWMKVEQRIIYEWHQ